jgi:hypothetical protein
MDRNVAFAIPFKELEKLVSELHRTPDKHWHINVDEDASGALHLLTKQGKEISLANYEIRLGKE